MVYILCIKDRGVQGLRAQISRLSRQAEVQVLTQLTSSLVLASTSFWSPSVKDDNTRNPGHIRRPSA